jgi:hypothetical protein
MATPRFAVVHTHQLDPVQKTGVYRLWNTEYPAQLAFADLSEFEVYLMALHQQDHYVLETAGAIVGWAFSFLREEEKWFAIILSQQVQRQGMGTTLLNILKSKEDKLAGWVIDQNNYTRADNEPYISPLGFYLKNGFETGPARLETPKLSAVRIYWAAKNTDHEV